MSAYESEGADWIDEGAQCIQCGGMYLELLHYVAGTPLVECGDCGRVYFLPQNLALQAEMDDMPVIELNEFAHTLDEYFGDVSILGDAPFGDGFSW